MVTFSIRKSGAIDSFTITVPGDESIYIDTLATISTIFSRLDTNSQLTNDEIYCLCNLLESMLPTHKQLNIDK